MDDLIRGAICIFIGNRASKEQVRQSAESGGYTNIRDIEFVNRSHPRAGGCGFYRASADRGGREYVLFANARSGEIIGRRQVGGYRDDEADLTEEDIRRELRRQGYSRIRDVSYVRRDGDDFYRVRADRDGNVYSLRVSDETGEVLNRRLARDEERDQERDHPNRRGMTPSEVRQVLEQAGYRRIERLEYTRYRGEDFYSAHAWRDDDGFYSLRIDDARGEITDRRRLRQASMNVAELSEEEIASSLSRLGYREIQLRYRQDRGTDFYAARAVRNGTQYRLRISDETGEVLDRSEWRSPRDLNDRAELNEEQIRRALRRQGYDFIESVRYVSNSEGDWYVAQAWRGGVFYRLIVDDENGDVVRRREIRD